MVDFFFIFTPIVYFFAYLIGAFPTGWLLAYKAGISDITHHGSGNIGATNVGRVLGPLYFIGVLLIDCCKAYLFLWIVGALSFDTLVIYASAVLLLIGNGFSIFLQGKGGKGVATSLGILLAVNPVLILYLCCAWLPVALFTHTMGIACVAGLLTLPYCAWFLMPYDTNFMILSFFIALWGLWRHETNIRRYCASKKVKI